MLEDPGGDRLAARRSLVGMPHPEELLEEPFPLRAVEHLAGLEVSEGDAAKAVDAVKE